jgi:hypothetical protein
VACQRWLAPQTSSDPQLPHFLVVVLAVEDLPLLRAFEDDLALRGDLLPGRRVDARFLGEEFLQSLARFLADGIAVFIETDFVNFGQRIGYRVG